MKKLALKVALLTVLVAAVLITVNSLYVRTQGYKNILALQDTNKLHGVPGDLTVANFGSSHGQCAFDYHDMGVRGFNFALSSQDFYYDYQLARRFKDKLAKGCVVLIPVSYLSFGITERQALAYSYRYYGILPYRDIIGHNALDYFRVRCCPVLFGAGQIRWVVHDQPPTYLWAMKLTKNKYSADALRSIGRRVANKDKPQAEPPESVYDFNRTYLDKLVSYSQKEGWRPVLVTTPLTQYYMCNFSQAFLDDFHARVDKLSKKYGVPYLDFSHDTAFASNSALFNDASHLNVPGRAQFTRMVIENLKGMELLPDGSTQ